jgi:hypothetical protein
LIELIVLALAGLLAATTITTKLVRGRRLAREGFWDGGRPRFRQGDRLRLSANERLRVYGDRVRVGFDEYGVQVMIIGFGLVIAVLLGALVGGM